MARQIRVKKPRNTPAAFRTLDLRTPSGQVLPY